MFKILSHLLSTIATFVETGLNKFLDLFYVVSEKSPSKSSLFASEPDKQAGLPLSPKEVLLQQENKQLIEDVRKVQEQLQLEQLNRSLLQAGLPTPKDCKAFVLDPLGNTIEATDTEVLTEIAKAKNEGLGVNLLDITDVLSSWNKAAHKPGSAMVKWDASCVLSKMEFDNKGNAQNKVYIAVHDQMSPGNWGAITQSIKQFAEQGDDGVSVTVQDLDGEKKISSINVQEVVPGVVYPSDPLNESEEDKNVSHIAMRDPLEILEQAKKARIAFANRRKAYSGVTTAKYPPVKDTAEEGREKDKLYRQARREGWKQAIEAGEVASWSDLAAFRGIDTAVEVISATAKNCTDLEEKLTDAFLTRTPGNCEPWEKEILDRSMDETDEEVPSGEEALDLYLSHINKALKDGTLSGRGAIMDEEDVKHWVPANETEAARRKELLAVFAQQDAVRRQHILLENAKWEYASVGKLPDHNVLGETVMKEFWDWADKRAQVSSGSTNSTEDVATDKQETTDRVEDGHLSYPKN